MVRAPEQEQILDRSDNVEDVVVFIPKLVLLLWGLERKKGAPLTKQEVLDIRDRAPTIAMQADDARELEQTRGSDIDPARCWEEWQQARLDQMQEDQPG